MPVMLSPPGPRVVINGREVLYFAGTGYLGLQGDPRVIEAACDAARRFGVHPATSRTGFGESPLLLAVEDKAAAFFGADAAFYFVSGYAGMSVLVASVPSPVDLILADDWLHLAGQDAARLSHARIERFRHGDPDHLRAQLAAHDPRRGNALVLCDGVSPVRGDIAPIHAYLDVLHAHGAGRLVVDDAHGVGVLGSKGRGSIEHAAEQAGDPITVNPAWDVAPGRNVWMCATLSKAIGGGGGILPGSAPLIAQIRSRASWYHGAAASAAPVAGATAAALDVCLADPSLRDRLALNARHLRSGLKSLGLDLEDWPTPIICLQIGDGANMARIQRALLTRGIAVAHSRNYPGVDDEGALRIAVFATHTTEMIDELFDALRALL